MNKRLCITAVVLSAVTFGTNVLGSGSLISPPQSSHRDLFWPHTHYNDIRAKSVFPLQRDNNHQQVIAYGTHQCQSEKSIGHTCKVSSLVTDCAEAYAVLKRQDCCATTKEGGQSIGFTLGNCGAYAQP